MVRASNVLRAYYMVIMGPPGAGKGTIANRAARDFKLKHVSSGDLLRSQVLKATAAGTEVKKYLDKAQLVPDELMCNLILAELQKLRSVDWLLDGFPRTVPQAQVLVKEFKLSCVVNLKVPDEEIIERIKHRWVHPASGRIYHSYFSPPKEEGKDDATGEPLIQRDDDKPEMVKARLVSYKTETAPVLQMFKEAKILQEFQGRESNEIWPRVHKYLTGVYAAKN